jgi:hypothetical protein
MKKILIAHRGNINGVNLSMENDPVYIERAINKGFDCEVDLRLDSKSKKFSLGHDEPKYEVSLDWILTFKKKLWIHCKNLESLAELSDLKLDLNYFWHQEDDYTLTSKGFIWTYPGRPTTFNSILVSLEDTIPNGDYLGICSDYPEKLKTQIEK